METQTWLSFHYKFISAKNIIILSVSSDAFLHAFLKVAGQQKACKKSSEETESIIIFFAEINL